MKRRWILTTSLIALTAGTLAAADEPATREAPTSAPAPAATTPAKASPPKRIVFIVDHSVAVEKSFDGIKDEIAQAVRNMLPSQSFDIVLVSEKSESLFPDLQRASPAAKEEVAMKLRRIETEGIIDGKLDPFQDAFEAAFALKAEQIYFLSASPFDPDLLTAIDKRNRNHKVRISTLAFGRHDEKFEDQMKELAKRNGGNYKFVAAADVPAATQPK